MRCVGDGGLSELQWMRQGWTTQMWSPRDRDHGDDFHHGSSSLSSIKDEHELHPRAIWHRNYREVEETGVDRITVPEGEVHPRTLKPPSQNGDPTTHLPKIFREQVFKHIPCDTWPRYE